MKLNLLCILCFTISFSYIRAAEEDVIALINNHHRVCQQQSHLSDSVIENMRKERKVPNDKNVKKHVLCYAREAALISGEDVPNADVIKVKLMVQLPDENKINEIMNKCNGLTDPNLEEKATILIQCYLDNLPRNVHVL